MMDVTEMVGVVDFMEVGDGGLDLDLIYEAVRDMQIKRLHPGAIPCTFVSHRVPQSDDGVQLL